MVKRYIADRVVEIADGMNTLGRTVYVPIGYYQKLEKELKYTTMAADAEAKRIDELQSMLDQAVDKKIDEYEAACEKLEAENAKLRDYLADHQIEDNLYDIAVSQLEAEHNRYKTALEEIANLQPETNLPDGLVARGIARKALGKKE